MKNHPVALAVAIWLALVAPGPAQEKSTQHLNTRISPTEFRAIAAACAPDIPLATLRAIARAESAFHPYALSLDHPRRAAREQGFQAGEILLARQPTNLAEARAWTRWLLERGRSVSIGLVQISTQHASDLGLSVDELFDPCTNLRAGARVLTAEYQRAAAVRGEGQDALRQALSEYNSGSSTVGFDNGYVSSVVNGEFFSKTTPR